MSKVKLKRLKINQYRNVRPGTELHFDDGVNLVLGQNGSGKTTLLGLITCVAGSDLSALQGETFDLEYTITDGLFTASISVRCPSLPDDSTRASVPNFSYEVQLSRSDATDVCRIEGTPQGSRIIGVELVNTLPSSPFQSGFIPDVLSQLVPSSPFNYDVIVSLFIIPVARHDESLDAFLAMTGRPPVSQSAGTPPVTQLRFIHSEQPAVAQRIRKFAPRAIAHLVPRAHESPAGELRITAEENQTYPELAFLSDAAALLGFREAAWKPQVIQIGPSPGRSGRTFEVQGFAFSFTRHDGTTINHDLLSYGQKRLLSFFYYLAATTDIVIADELVNGLHHRWIERCMTAIEDRQAFLTSQNPILFEYVEFRSIEHVQACFVTCKTELVDGAEQLVWQNMAREDAISFFDSYQAGIESPGDILMTRGLW